MAFRKILPRVRTERGQHNVTYRNGQFRLNKLTAERAGFPEYVTVEFDDVERRVLLRPSTEENPEAHRLSQIGKADWGNAFSSMDLAKALNLPPSDQTVRYFVEWDEKLKALVFKADAGQVVTPEVSYAA